MIKINDVIDYLEQIAPLSYQEHYDNAGLMLGNAHSTVTGILICLDITEEVLAEAKAQNCNLIIAHHPLIFKPIKKLTARTYVERCIIQAIKQNLALYAIHTNLDNIVQGVNQQIAQALALNNVAILKPKKGSLSKLVTFVPEKETASVLQALHEAGAGNIGNYKNCSFVSEGIGSFQPSEAANPYLGKRNKLEKVNEKRIEVIFPSYLEKTLLEALHVAHPYEEVAYCVHKLENFHQAVGAGMVGELKEAHSGKEFLSYLKAKMNAACIRHTALIARPIKKVAVCGGAGSFLLKEAIAKQADAFITADISYHDFFNAEKKILIADIGHYESELCTKALIHRLLTKKFTNIVVLKCETVTNPINYF
ncbi:MAG: Nif3-like dinuclear metal center hexameric protein [Cytophagales bacterium]|nr:Nif3-like dinuclear metal center hexameric protein [Cytophagales bacterium]